MPREIPGFYYDAEKNRYFPYKGPIPGSSRKPKPKPEPEPPPKAKIRSKCMTARRNKLLEARELCGNVISSCKGKLNFQMECQKGQASQPMIWKYHGTEKVGNIALEHVDVDVTLEHGVIRRNVLLTGGVNGSLCLFEVGKYGEEIYPGVENVPDRVWPVNLGQQAGGSELRRHLWHSNRAKKYMPSEISCIKKLQQSSLPTDSKQILYDGLVYLLNLSKPLAYSSNPIEVGGFHELASFKHTVWSADCSSDGRQAAIGTSRGAALLNVETRRRTWVYHCKSDVLSLQFDRLGNLILCGLRNGAIVSVDARQKQLKQGMHPSSAITMPSSVCCLASLKLYDQYFLASSMDGSIKLYDHRLNQRGPVQSYDGNINSHTRLELGVDPSEKFVMSGGEDCYLRLWSIKSGEMLFVDRFMNSIPSVVCWPRVEGGEDYWSYWQNHSWGAWLGSYEGIFYMDWC